MDEVWQVLAQADALFDELANQQRLKVLKLAREAVPHLTGDDVLNPHDYPELHEHPAFEYEDGILAGILVAQTALRARVMAPLRHPEPPADPL
jgi:hypothetical protein